jgi:23S rRNA pseudouridine1911/1915/1917 synthase
VSESLAIFHYDGQRPERLDKFLVECIPDLSRTRLQNLIKDGLVSINGAAVTKAGLMLDMPVEISVSIPPPLPGNLIPENIPLEIVFENEDVIVINKPAGMVVHPAAGHTTGTLVHAALGHAPEMVGIGEKQRPGVVHRLDKDTSGLILMAKNYAAHRWLVEQFASRQAKKIYLTLVDGKPPTPKGRIEAPIGRSPTQRKMMAVVPPDKGRAAVTEYRQIEAFPAHTLLEVYPLTGRTHQIRVHLNFLGCPVVGDRQYGHRKPTLPINRQFLHAEQLTITLPGETSPRSFSTTLPPDLKDILANLRMSG